MTDGTSNSVPPSPPAAKTRLVGYRVVEGVPTLTDLQLAKLFERAKAERLLPLVMYNMSPDMTAATFVRFCKDAGRILWLVFYESKLAGWVWLDDFANRTARSHFCFFRWLSEGRLTEEVGREAFRQLFKMKFRGGTSLQVIRAEMPAIQQTGALVSREARAEGRRRNSERGLPGVNGKILSNGLPICDERYVCVEVGLSECRINRGLKASHPRF